MSACTETSVLFTAPRKASGRPKSAQIKQRSADDSSQRPDTSPQDQVFRLMFPADRLTFFFMVEAVNIGLNMQFWG